MIVINKVIVSKFRSFGDNISIECSDINIFSGGNDSGKSNFIKALNLFFNEKTDIFSRYSPENDFNKWFRDNNERGQRNISIKLYFRGGSYKDQSGINKGFIAEKIFGIDGSITSKYYLSENSEELAPTSASYKRADAVVRNSIKYIYIPAIRDYDFRKFLQRELLQISNSSSTLTQIFEGLKQELDDTFFEFGKLIRDKVDINVISDVSFSTLLESMSFSTDEQITITKRGRGAIEEKQSILMQNRGDGIQMQFLTFLLWFISTKDRRHKYIWGFEEPEIAYEFKKQFEMADIFRDIFSKNAQIFISTHSPAFIFKDNSPSIKQYRVYKDKDRSKDRIISYIENLSNYGSDLFAPNVHSTQLEKDIWGTNYQRMANTLGHILKETDDYKQIETQLQSLVEEVKSSKKQTEAKENELNEIKNKLKDIYPDKIFICEDANGVTIWEQLFSKINLEEIKILSSKGCCNDNVESAIIFKQTEQTGYNPKIFRQLDLDGYLPQQVLFLENIMPSKFHKLQRYKLKFLPVNELENFAVLSDPHFTKEFVTSDFDAFYAINNELTDTAKSNLLRVRSKYTHSEAKEVQNLFNLQESTMRNYAKEDILSRFPGKNICKLKNGFSAERKLKSLSIESFPESLSNYLTTIKAFFEND